MGRTSGWWENVTEDSLHAVAERKQLVLQKILEADLIGGGGAKSVGGRLGVQ